MTSYNEKNTSTFRQRDNINLLIMAATVCVQKMILVRRGFYLNDPI